MIAALGDAAWIVVVVIVVLVAVAAALTARRRLLNRGGGTVECGLRRPGSPWRLGVGQYGAAELRWYGALGVSLTPEETLPRRSLTVTGQRQVDPSEATLLGTGRVVVSCLAGERAEPVELSMGESALTGFLAWLESAPPGSYPLGL